MAYYEMYNNSSPPSFSKIEPAYWNYTDHVILEDLKIDSNFIWLLCSLVSAISWIIYITYYNSRVIGYIITRLLNRFVVRDGYVKVGSFTLCALSGKIMFRDIVYITTDYSVRVQDGWVIFRWWRSYVPKDVSEDLSHSDTRLSVLLNGFELHVYNRCQLYARLEKTFGLSSQMFPNDKENHTFNINERDDSGSAMSNSAANESRQQINAMDVSRHMENIRKQEAHVLARTWRDLIPVIKLDICCGRLVFGNRLVPTTLSIVVEEAHFVYSTKPAASRHDHFMHFTKCKAENFKVILAPSPKYTGMIDDPPRYMGEGFVVLSSNNIEFYYYMDEPGVVPEHPEMIRLANGDMVEAMPPIWGIDVKCGKGTDFSYGPWADRQREHLFKFFFPNDYQQLKVTKSPKPGEKRQVQSFDLRLSTLNEATIDILFSKNRETNAVHINVGAGSYLEITMPWIVLQDGFTTKITGQLLHLEATTSLQYRSLVESETLEFGVKCHYPLRWNDYQEWTLNLTGCKATANLVYAHKEFFQDMINDWASKSRPDILHFIPYTWKFSLLLKEFELITICNEYNWIDCSSQNQENAHIAFCGEIFDLSFDLPFTEFLPVTVPLRFWIQGESVDLSFFLPEVNTNRIILLAIEKNAKIITRDGSCKHLADLTRQKKWRNICQKSLGWMDCWSVPIVALSINYTYHPCPPLGPTPQANITTPEKEEILLSPMRIPRCRKSPGLQWTQDGNVRRFDVQSISPDKVSLELEIGSSILILYGSLMKSFLNLKENIFGSYQSFTDMQQSRSTVCNNSDSRSKDMQNSSVEASVVEDDDNRSKTFDPRYYRPIEVTVGITIHDIQAHLVKNCNEDDPPCPVIILERFGFEMRKAFKETELQLLLSPAIMLLTDNVSRMSSKERHLSQGHLMLSALQVRGHAMFSNEGRSLDQETLEYAWLIEVQLGKLSGKITSPQLYHLVTSLETFLLTVKDTENLLRPPGLPHHCHHGLPPLQCPDSDPDNHYRCPTSEDIKYRMTRVAIDVIDLYIQEAGTATQLWISPIRVSTCNLHGQQVKSGITGVMPTILIRQFVSAASYFANTTSNTNTTGSGRSHTNSNKVSSGDGSDMWLEVGSISMGPVIIEAAISLPKPEHNLHIVQNKYLKTHDEATKRLWFLWPQDNSIKPNKCGCIGGCAFFGNNRNGPRFFKPSYYDLQDGINIAAYRINTSGKEKGFGQSILHDGQLVFHTPPYSLQDVSLQDVTYPLSSGLRLVVVPDGHPQAEKTKSGVDEDESTKVSTTSKSPASDKKLPPLGRRFSYTSIRGSNLKDIPYSRLVDASPVQLPQKLDSDSKLNSERSRSILCVPENTPKSSASDSKLAVDYFNTPETDVLQQSSPQSLPVVTANSDPRSSKMPTSARSADGVNISDSYHSSLYGDERSDSDERLKQEVQRTISMSSENHSEAFYSADEDPGHYGSGGSRTSSLRQSIVSTGYPTLIRNDSMKKKYSSDLSIVESTVSVTGVGEKAHTLERAKPQRECLQNPRVIQSHFQESEKDPSTPPLPPSPPAEKNLLRDSSGSSVSSTSFISAVSSQEDMTLVNLHMQVNKPIVDSPLLMSNYVNHLTQVRCPNWSQSSLSSASDAFTTPMFRRTEDERLVYIGGRFTPKFDVITEGFTSLKMVTRNDNSPVINSSNNKTPTHPYVWDSSALIQSKEEDDGNVLGDNDEELLAVQHETGSSTTIIIKLKGDVDIMISPMVLESLQKFIDVLTPTLATLHPLTILNHLHSECISRVEDANILKQDQSLSYWSQVQTSSKRSTAERNIKNGQGDEKSKTAIQTNVYEESITTQIQGTIILPKINITLLQTSVVEEIISFSALDNIRDLTCVSLFAICFEEVNARFYNGKQAREVVHTFNKPAVMANQKKVNKISKAFLSGHQSAAVVTEISSGETVYIETSEKQQEEIIITLIIGKAHSQLRRLRNESSILKDAVITAISAHHSRVLFTHTRLTSPLKCVDYYLHQPTEEKEKQNKQTTSPQATEEFTSGNGEDRLGFIMFECGLEGIKLKIVKRSQFEKGDNGQDDDKKNEREIFYASNVKNHDETENTNSKTNTNTPATTITETDGNTANGTASNAGPINSGGVSNSLVARSNSNGNTVSGVIELKTVWFNFAAPPRAPITRKIDFTRLDWNLLSTASPAINAWMNSSNRFAIQIVHMFRSMYKRSTAVVACLMAEALDEQGIHMPVKSRYGRLTPLAKTLQEDPSCQLCSILQKYVVLSDLPTINTNLCESKVPHLSTLRQGVIVLSRQWKNILYTPLLLEHNYKTKHVKPLNVTFAVSDPEDENLLTDGEGSAGDGDDQEVTDECAMLIHTDHMYKHAQQVKISQDKSTGICDGGDGLTVPVSSPRGLRDNITPSSTPVPGPDSLTSPSPPIAQQTKKGRSLQPTQVPVSSRASIVFPLLAGGGLFNPPRDPNNISYGTLQEEKTPQIHVSHSHNMGSNPSIYSGGAGGAGGHGSHTHSTGSIDQITSPVTHQSSRIINTGEDLYSWMAKQQEFVKDNDKGNLKGNWDSKINTMTTEDTEDSDIQSGACLYPMKDSLRLLDAHLIFEPLLSSLSVMPQQMLSAIGSGNVHHKNNNNANNSNNNNISSFDSLGSNLSLVGTMDTMRIDIVVSEFGKVSTDKKKPNKYGIKKGSKISLDIPPPETPAFLCERIGIDIDVKKMADMTVDDMIQRQNILYISRGQLKKHTSTVVNFSLNIRYINQQVNMPLLRLLHQISNMYQNVKETQMELKEQLPSESKRTTANLTVNEGTIKNGSSSTSDVQEQLLLAEDGSKKLEKPLLQASSYTQDQFKVLSPSNSIRSRPQSFAQKLRSTGKSVKGYINLNEGVITPSNFGTSPNTVSGLDKFSVISDKCSKESSTNLTPRCWRTIYYLLDLYATRPETKTITHRFSFPAEAEQQYGKSGRWKYENLNETKETDIEKGLNRENGFTPVPNPQPYKELNVVTDERTRLFIFGVAKIHRTRLLATLSGLKLEAEITSLHASLTCRKKSKPVSSECSLTGQIGRTMIVLLEGVAPNQQTVVKVTVGKSQALYSSMTRRHKDKNSGLLTVGAVNIDIPQHPVALHGMMTRGSKQLSSTLQELRVTRTSSRMSRAGQQQQQPEESDPVPQGSPHHHDPPTSATIIDVDVDVEKPPDPGPSLLEPIVMQFHIILQSLSITAALLPSLQAQYKMDQVNSSGITGSKAKFTIDLPQHSLSFTTKLQVTEANLPSEASIELPKVHVSAEYIQDGNNNLNDTKIDGVVLRQGSYLSATADIGIFEHSLTTDLLNHLVFVQKVFMKEVNEVVQKVYGGEKPVPLWLEDEEPTSSSLKRILFSLTIRIKRIQLTATTPTNSAVRLETGAVELQLSNRVQNVLGSTQPNPYMKLFGKAQLDINLSLGQLLKNVIFEEAEPEFQQFAFFNTRVGLRNAFQEEMAQGADKELVLITLKRPLIYIQPMAVDKAILVWLNYKNAYEYWNEKRANLNKEVLTATQQVFEKVPFGQLTSQLSSQHLGTLFLQLTVDDMGICIPLNPLPPNTWGTMTRGLYDGESRGAVVVTLENTSISACSSGSLVSKGRFIGLCLRFAEDFETSLDDWKPDMNDSSIMNLCVVSEGTYEVCSRTVAQKQDKSDNAKWLLNVQWQMEGVDIHMDVSVGQQLSALGHTLTMLTGSEEDDAGASVDYDSDDGDQPENCSSQVKKKENILIKKSKYWTDNLPAFVFDPSLDAKKRSKLIEKEMHEQAKIINDLRSLGASHGTIEQEMKRLHELEAMVFKDFRRDMIQKLRRQSVKASSIKGKLGLGSKPNAYRSRSFIVPSPTPEHQQLESPEDMNTDMNSGNSASYESSPRSGPSRSASLKVNRALSSGNGSSAGGNGPRVTFNDNHTMCRQSSLPSASSDLSLPEVISELQWPETIDIDGEQVEIRRKNRLDMSNASSYNSMDGNVPLIQTSTASSPYIAMPQKPQEPNIDFELDVKVLINSGKCVLHTKDPAREDELKLLSRMKKERSCSGGNFDFQPSSPSSSKKHLGSKEKSATASTSRLRYMQQHPSVPLVDLTIFHIPGLDVKVHYESKTLPEEVSISPRTSAENNLLNPTIGIRKSSTKKASLFAWMTLQSIPEETIISPHILEFLEQTLEPIPSSKTFVNNSGGHVPIFPIDNNESTSWTAASGNYAYASFPVDVIVYFHMQPSTFRFSCLPVSRVECLLQLPSLDIVFSSKRAEEELPEFRDFKSPGASSSTSSGKESSAIGGVSVTGCLADFSVYIFHPYGGGKKTSLKEAQWSPLSDSERKDSLSINVEFVKFHLSRSRRVNFQSEQSKKGVTSDASKAVIRFSTIVDIGSASFKYDMRRITEILAFPKAWYRRSIVRRLFLGDLNPGFSYSDGRDDNLQPISQDEAVMGSSLLKHYDRHYGTGDILSKSAPEPSPTLQRDKLRLSFDSEMPRQMRLKDIGRGWSFTSEKINATTSEMKKRESAWETLVLFAINFTRLNVHMNMGNVMGNVAWMTKDFRSNGRLSIGSTGHKNLFIGIGLGGSSLDAKGGFVGGTIELSKIDTYIHIREEPGTEPDHTLGLKLFALELRLDYMGTSVLMTRVSSLDVTLRDEWKINTQTTNNNDAFMPTRRPAIIFMHGDLGWDQLQIMISKSTTADLLKMFYKLDEFFSQQFKSSKRVFSSLQPRNQRVISSNSFKKRQQKKKSSDGPWTLNQTAISDARHHRHWQRVLTQVAGLQLGTLQFSLPSNGTVLGGTMELHGCNISLACFHGINFKSKNWALFSLKEPCISFATEAQEIPSVESANTCDVHVVQTLTISLGQQQQEQHAKHHSMATVCKLSRSVLFPPQFKSLQEWFHYAFANSEIDAVDRFPCVERERSEVPPDNNTNSRGRSTSSASIKLQEHTHTREVIFALPSLQLHLKTEHLQTAKTPDVISEKPLVECSFITEFEDHIFVTVDAEAFFFLHDLITSYVNEKEKVHAGGLRTNSPDPQEKRSTNKSPASNSTSIPSTSISEEEKKRKQFDPAEMFIKDWRSYRCKTWHLEPTVRLLSWAGKSIEPYGIDYILQKLGFSHARTTIPKWIQRGFMDPLDKLLAVLMLRMVLAVREETTSDRENKKERITRNAV
ncbi:transmembrane protein KIAA1109 homolog isoform X1 [Chelonus insularis]|uniref:transmembrane protein KIAA1109 homolog isoform X1 n=1 Tax=Chelonus insularis TaxID=460826 RepID=UPI00158AE44F|nr:transmembrane protein KIAA1109 homolog isoform X1 [Chelonus insularis]XP_034943294.1 transmembrane protein KIAA1109 homolog isoform X1 [Chelonus insularis]